MRTARASTVLSCVLTALVGPAACGGQPTPTPPPASVATLECPPPVGRVPRESCADIADDFGALTVSGALKLAGTGHDAETRIAAIRAAGALANALKEKRVALCEAYDACKVSPKDHAAEDTRLAGLMTALIQLWDARRFADPSDVARFREQLAALEQSFDGRTSAAAATSSAPSPAAPKSTKLSADALAELADPAVSFQAAGGSITASARDAASHEVLKSRADRVPLEAGKRYQITVTGSFTPASPSFGAGDLLARISYRAVADGEIVLALRSLEDPEPTDATTVFKVKAGEKGTREAKLSAAPGTSGVYLGIGAHGGAVDLDDVELRRDGATLASARAESASEPGVSSRCAELRKKPLAGKASFRCEPDANRDVVTLGEPTSYLFVTVRGASGEKARLRTASLEGGRTIDASLTEPSELVIGVVGGGTATIAGLEITEIVR